MEAGSPIKIEIKEFWKGLAPAWHKNSNTEMGAIGQASDMQDCDTLDPNYLTQGSGKAALTNGTQAGVVDELIRYIMKVPVSADVAYAVAATKLHKISSTTVSTGGSPSWPQAVTNMTDGESIFRIGANIYIPHNKSSGGDIAKMVISTEAIDNDWASTTPTGFAALLSAPHPSESKEDIGVIGNGRYVCTYHADDDTLDVDKLDFETGAEVVDVKFHANLWWIAVNSPNLTGNNSAHGRIYLWGADALSTQLEDEIDLGFVRIGFMAIVKGEVIVCYQDLTDTGGFEVGVLRGRSIDESTIKQFTGSLPTFAQWDYYKNGIIFLSSGETHYYGSAEGFPRQLCKLATTTYATNIGALAAPFGTPIMASDNASSYILEKFSGYSLSMDWTSLTFDITEIDDNGAFLKGNIEKLLVLTNHLGSGARLDLNFQFNQNQGTAITKQITTSGKRFHELLINQICEDFRINLSAANGSTTNNVGIRKIIAIGRYVGV